MTDLPKKKVLIFLDLDLTIRHFIKSGVFRELEAACDVTYVFAVDPDANKHSINIDCQDLGLPQTEVFHTSRRRSGRWFYLAQTAVLFNQRGTRNFKPRLDLTREIYGKKWARIFRSLSLPVLFPLVRRLMLRKIGVHHPLEAFLAKHRPDVVLHPTVLAGYVVNDLIQSCRRLRIPLALLMNSWDNPSVKAIVTGYPDRLVVWGDQTRQHAIDYMRFPPERIECFGAAQFQLYRTPEEEDDASLRRRFQVPEGVPIILYAGAGRGQHETDYIRALEATIAAGKVPPCHVLYRPHPWRGPLAPGEQSFYELNCKHVSIDPHMKSYYDRVVVQGGADVMEMADYTITKKLLTMASAVISPLSTILLESIILGKPVLMFFPGKKLSLNKLTELSLRAAQFQEFWGVPGVNINLEDEGLAASFAQLMAQAGDADISASLRRHAGKFVVTDGPTYGERLVAMVEQLSPRAS